MFADVPFAVVDGIRQVKSFDELPEALASLGEVENIHSCAAYLAAVKSQSKSFNLKYLIAEGERIVRKDVQMTEAYQRELEALLSFYDDAYRTLSELPA